MKDNYVCDACGKHAPRTLLGQVQMPIRWLTRKVSTGFMFQRKDEHFCSTECAYLYDEYKKESAK